MTLLLCVMSAVLHQEAPDGCHSGGACQQLGGRRDCCTGVQQTPQPLQQNSLGLHVQVCWGVCALPVPLIGNVAVQ